MLKISGSTESKIQPGEGGVGVDGSRAGQDGSGFDKSRIGDGEVDGVEVGDNEIGKKVQNLFKSKNSSKSDFFTLGAKLAFTKLRQTFVKAQILYPFNLERHIRIEMDASGYAIDRVLSQLTLNDLG